MAEKKSGAKNLYDLAKAIARWDNDGGATAPPDPDTSLRKHEERILRCLGAAVMIQWNDLPTEIQRSLFEGATSMSDPARQFQLKQLIARFLRDHKDGA